MGAKSFTKSAEILKPDPIYGSLVLSKFINCVMYDGKKATAQRVVFGAMISSPSGSRIRSRWKFSTWRSTTSSR